MDKQVLYQKLKSSDIGVTVDSYNTLGSLSWEAYLPSDSELVVDNWFILLNDQSLLAGMEIYYSAKNDEFYLREWKQGFNEDKTINKLKVISKEEVVEKIVNEELVDEISPGWQREFDINRLKEV